MAVISGTGGSDTRIGTSSADTIGTGNGDDRILALQGNDTAWGGNGSDSAWGGDGRDWLYGQNGADSLLGDAGGDRLEGGNDNDHLNGGTGDDTLWGGNGADQAWGADGKDSLYGNTGADLLGGGNGDDLLQGGTGNDSLRGAAGTDSAAFAGTIAGYDIVRTGALITVTDTDTSNGDDGTDVLVGVESLRFADRTVTFADLDLDVLLAGDGGSTLLVDQGGTQGGTPGDRAAGAGPASSGSAGAAVLGDLDSDGDLDALIGTSAGTALFFNDGNGGFAAGNDPDLAGLPFTEAIALGDLDGDGDLDALLLSDRHLVALDNQGGDQAGTEGDFARRTLATITDDSFSEYPYDVALGDLDGDGDLDAVIASKDGAGRFAWNQSDVEGSEGKFTLVNLFAGYDDTRAIAIADFDGDDDLDVLMGSSGQANRLLTNQGGNQGGNEGDFVTTEVPGTSPNVMYAIAAGDIDGDGDIDALAGGPEGLLLLTNQGGTTATFAGTGLATPVDALVDSIALADLDGDGDLDAIVGYTVSSYTPSLTVTPGYQLQINQGGLQGGSEGTFEAIDTSGTAAYAIAIGDLDGDGTAGLTPDGLPVVGPGVPIAADPGWLA
ncbi:MAG: calcium-binding protein [Geminicoccaceae bacterium]